MLRSRRGVGALLRGLGEGFEKVYRFVSGLTQEFALSFEHRIPVLSSSTRQVRVCGGSRPEQPA
jgi:hypothetical protein